jgi:hypothetical protein
MQALDDAFHVAQLGHAVVTAQSFQHVEIARRNTAFFAMVEIEKQIRRGKKTLMERPLGRLDGDMNRHGCVRRPGPFNWAARCLA